MLAGARRDLRRRIPNADCVLAAFLCYEATVVALEELMEQDARRLDWLLSGGRFVQWAAKDEYESLVYAVRSVRRDYSDATFEPCDVTDEWPKQWHPSPRDAIDAAMRSVSDPAAPHQEGHADV